MVPTSFPELPKPSRTSRKSQQPVIQSPKSYSKNKENHVHIPLLYIYIYTHLKGPYRGEFVVTVYRCIFRSSMPNCACYQLKRSGVTNTLSVWMCYNSPLRKTPEANMMFRGFYRFIVFFSQVSYRFFNLQKPALKPSQNFSPPPTKIKNPKHVRETCHKHIQRCPLNPSKTSKKHPRSRVTNALSVLGHGWDNWGSCEVFRQFLGRLLEVQKPTQNIARDSINLQKHTTNIVFVQGSCSLLVFV